jgi:uncharacterized membrane protein YtjA (UPF0391 family)
MLYWAVVFFVIAIIAGVLGFSGLLRRLAGYAKILSTSFLYSCRLLISGMMRRGRGVDLNGVLTLRKEQCIRL